MQILKQFILSLCVISLILDPSVVHGLAVGSSAMSPEVIERLQNEEIARAVLDKYQGLGKLIELGKVTKTKQGNRFFEIKTANGDFVIEEHDKDNYSGTEHLAYEYTINRFHLINHFPSPKMRATNSNRIGVTINQESGQDRVYSVTEKAKGFNFDELDSKQLDALAKSLAKHRRIAPFIQFKETAKTNYVPFLYKVYQEDLQELQQLIQITMVKKEVGSVLTSVEQKLIDQVENISRWASLVTDQKFHARMALLPQGVVHGDLQAEHVYFDGKGEVSSIVEWDQAGQDAYITDLASGVFDLINLDVDQFKDFAKSYQKYANRIGAKQKVTNEELEMLRQLMIVRVVREIRQTLSKKLDTEDDWRLNRLLGAGKMLERLSFVPKAPAQKVSHNEQKEQEQRIDVVPVPVPVVQSSAVSAEPQESAAKPVSVSSDGIEQQVSVSKQTVSPSDNIEQSALDDIDVQEEQAPVVYEKPKLSVKDIQPVITVPAKALTKSLQGQVEELEALLKENKLDKWSMLKALRGTYQPSKTPADLHVLLGGPNLLLADSFAREVAKRFKALDKRQSSRLKKSLSNPPFKHIMISGGGKLTVQEALDKSSLNKTQRKYFEKMFAEDIASERVFTEAELFTEIVLTALAKNGYKEYNKKEERQVLVFNKERFTHDEQEDLQEFPGVVIFVEDHSRHMGENVSNSYKILKNAGLDLSSMNRIDVQGPQAELALRSEQTLSKSFGLADQIGQVLKPSSVRKVKKQSVLQRAKDLQVILSEFGSFKRYRLPKSDDLDDGGAYGDYVQFAEQNASRLPVLNKIIKDEELAIADGLSLDTVAAEQAYDIEIEQSEGAELNVDIALEHKALMREVQKANSSAKLEAIFDAVFDSGNVLVTEAYARKVMVTEKLVFSGSARAAAKDLRQFSLEWTKDLGQWKRSKRSKLVPSGLVDSNEQSSYQAFVAFFKQEDFVQLSKAGLRAQKSAQRKEQRQAVKEQKLSERQAKLDARKELKEAKKEARKVKKDKNADTVLQSKAGSLSSLQLSEAKAWSWKQRKSLAYLGIATFTVILTFSLWFASSLGAYALILGPAIGLVLISPLLLSNHTEQAILSSYAQDAYGASRAALRGDRQLRKQIQTLKAKPEIKSEYEQIVQTLKSTSAANALPLEAFLQNLIEAELKAKIKDMAKFQSFVSKQVRMALKEQSSSENFDDAQRRLSQTYEGMLNELKNAAWLTSA